jgi:hypothetical protein
MSKKTISLRVEEKDLKYIKSYVRKISSNKDIDFSHNDLIRKLIKKFIKENDNAS